MLVNLDIIHFYKCILFTFYYIIETVYASTCIVQMKCSNFITQTCVLKDNLGRLKQTKITITFPKNNNCILIYSGYKFSVLLREPLLCKQSP